LAGSGETCFGRVGAGNGCTVTGVTEATGAGVATTRAGGGTVRSGAATRFARGTAGARTTLRLGPGPSAIPNDVGGEASKRGISAPPATATTSNSAAVTRSFRLMLFPSPADNFP